MKLCSSLNRSEPTLSFELFPPKTEEREQKLFSVLEQLKGLKPDFASVTCGALGSNRNKTVFWAKQIKNRFKIEPVVHLTCVAQTKASVLEHLKELTALGIDNILALRGDPPAGQSDFTPPQDGFAYARDLLAFIRGHRLDLCIGVAGYPEGHIESASLKQDTQHLKEKVAAGADYIITQLFFDNRFFFDFIDRARRAGIEVPIIPGIMPITSLNQVKKMTEMCGATIPERLLDKLEQAGKDKEAVIGLGVDWAADQCQELLDAGVKGLHFFVMNQAKPVSQILGRLRSFRRQ
ncbi:MAG: methylenetetrahydrofolate reductase [NAD(P)H] [Candidatus Saganbacteria bacterium]|nr:methylenetetrahydrofolate reductase [NAD(P)H] [Candidatus Saganbacteria bacterium]